MSPAENLRALGERIRAAARPHAEGKHVEVRADCTARGLRDRTTHARLSVRVGDWATGGAATLAGHDEERAARECIEALRARLTRRAAELEAQLAATRAALGVLP